MNNEAVRKKRMEEIELKKKRLEEMRKSRLNVNDSSSSLSPTFTNQLSSENAHSEIKQSSQSENIALGSNSVINLETDALVSKLLEDKKFGHQIKPEEKAKQFSIVKSTTVFDILPKEVVKYDKYCQTETEDETIQTDHNDSPTGNDDLQHPNSRHSNSTIFETTNSNYSVGESHQSSRSITTSSNQSQRKCFSEEEKKYLMQDTKFLHFFCSASLTVERALEFTDTFDIFKNYAYDSEARNKENSDLHKFERQESYEEEALFGRPIMDMKWSSLIGDLFLTAYGAKGTSNANGKSGGASVHDQLDVTRDDDSQGIVCIWSKELHKRSERKLSTSSPVLTALFHPLESHFVVGGCYSGQIVLWDLRVLKSNPIQRSSLTGKGHKHPVYGMAFVTSGAATCELVSISADGIVCTWDIGRLNDPLAVTSINLSGPSFRSQVSANSELSNLFSSPMREKSGGFGNGRIASNTNSLSSVSCLAASQDNQNQILLVGYGSGELFKSTLPYKANGSANQQCEAHNGLITAIHVHPQNSSHTYRNLVLTASIDWTIKLWNLADLATPVYEFLSPTCDYQCDVQWSPTHAGVFASITSSGKLCLWNLFQTLTEPIKIIELTKDENMSSTGSSHKQISSNAIIALSKVMWTKDGQSLLVGDSIGKIHRVKVNSQLINSSHSSDDNCFENLLSASVLNTNPVANMHKTTAFDDEKQ